MRRDTAVDIQFEPHILLAVVRIAAFGETDRVEKLGLAVFADVRVGQLEVVVQAAVVTDIPDESGSFAVAAAFLGEQGGLAFFEVFERSARIPVRHCAAVLGVHEVTFERVFEYLPSQLAAVFERPEQRPVVKPVSGFGQRLCRIRIADKVREGFLEQVVKSDPEHEHIQPLFKYPVDFLLPVVKTPVLGLEAVQTAMREIAQSAVLEAGRFGDVDIVERQCAGTRNPIAVPEITAAAEQLEVAVYCIYCRARPTAGQNQHLMILPLRGNYRIVVGIVPDIEAIDYPLKIELCGQVIDRVASENDNRTRVVGQ